MLVSSILAVAASGFSVGALAIRWVIKYSPEPHQSLQEKQSPQLGPYRSAGEVATIDLPPLKMEVVNWLWDAEASKKLAVARPNIVVQNVDGVKE